MAPKKSTKRKSTRRPYRKRMMRRINVLNLKKTDNYATIEETFSMQATAGITFNTQITLADDFVRAQQLAKAFQFYRITSITMRFKPRYDTYTTTGNSELPYLYFVYDRSNTLPPLSIPQFEQVGVKPIRFDDKVIVKRYKPAVMGESSGNLPAQFRISPWLPTNTDNTGAFQMSDVQHYGTVFVITKVNANDALDYDIDVTATIQFKAPLVPYQAGQQQKINPPRGHKEFGTDTSNNLNI